MGEGELDWIPAGGAHLARPEVVAIFMALRALVDGTEPDEPNRAHAVTIAYLIAEAVERAGGGA